MPLPQGPTSPEAPPPPQRLDDTLRAGALAFVTAAVTLDVQVLVHRVVAAKLLNNYAFLVISLTMLGFAVSGIVLARSLEAVLKRLDAAAGAFSALFVLTLLGATSLFDHAAAGPQFSRSRQDLIQTLAHWIPLALLFAVPFAFAGLILGALLSSPRLPTRRIYFFDLLGSALGAFAVIPSISSLGAENSILVACGVLLVAALVLAPPRGGALWLLETAAILAVVLAGAFSGRVFEISYPLDSMLAATRIPGSGMVLEHVAWDPVARIEVSSIPPVSPDHSYDPCLIGNNATFHARFRKMLTQNNYAYTYAVDYDGSTDSLKGIDETIYSAAYQASAPVKPRVLVIGVGGGFDILTALYFGASHVTAVEINSAIVKILKQTYADYFKNWVRDPRVELVTADGRHYLAATHGTYDVIQLSGVDSYSGTPGAAHVFSENYLYTSEAFDSYLAHLSEGGILNMMRLEYMPEREMLRALATAVAALRRAGCTAPEKQIVTVNARGGRFTALLLKKTPFTEAELVRLDDWAARDGLVWISAEPRAHLKPRSRYGIFLALGGPRAEAAATALYPFDISPTDDDRPFFFRYSRWGHLLSKNPDVMRSIPVMEYSLLMLLLVIGAAVFACILVPLRFFPGLDARHSGAWRYGLVFAGTGLGYLAIEMALLQRFGLFLGHPNYALSVVLASLLFASGLGSLFSARLTALLGRARFVAYVLSGVLLLEYGLVLPRLGALQGAPFALRAGLVFLLVLPVGVCLGVFVPTALEALKAEAPALVPWAWGINGAFSVLAPVLSIAVSMTFGISALLLSAIPVYLVVALALPEAAPTPAP